MKRKLLIIGASGHGKVVADIAKQMNHWEEICFIDDNAKIDHVVDIKVIGTIKDAYKHIKDCEIFIAIGNNKVREKLYNEFSKLGAIIPTLIHPSSVISERVIIGRGTAIMAGVVINSDTKIGEGVIINTAATVDHDNEIDSFVHISPGVNVAGTVNIRSRTWIGIGASIVNNICIAKDCIIGAGSVVTNNIKESGTYVGVPVRRIKSKCLEF